MDEYVKGLMKAVQLTRADMLAAQREHDAAVQELLSELDKCARGVVRNHTSCGATTKGTGCGTCDVCKAVKVIMRGSGEGDTPEKRVEGIGPHTSAGEAKGRVVHDYHCDWWISGPCTCGIATHHATQPTQVPRNKGPDTTSHG